jgi:hypothetical protein
MMLVCPKDSKESPSSVQIHRAEPVQHPASVIIEPPEADQGPDNDLPITHQPKKDEAADSGDEA